MSLLMPPPYSQQHNQYLRNYAETGKAKISGRKLDLFAIRKDRSVFPINILVSKVTPLPRLMAPNLYPLNHASPSADQPGRF